MCGIFGGIGASQTEVENCLNNILRGNDGITVSKYGEVVMGSRRHLVKESDKKNIAPGQSDQPYLSDDKEIILVFNGELYNFNQLRDFLSQKGVVFHTNGDTEVFLKLYEYYGSEFVKQKTIDSLFAIGIYDKNLNKIMITRDFPGRVPLFYYYNKQERTFLFSSELKGFRGIPRISLNDPIELKPGHIVILDIESFNIFEERYYHATPHKTNWPLMKVGEELHNILQESGRNRTMGDVPICTMLSGGIDSLLTTFYVFSNVDFNKVDYKPTSYVFAIEDYVSEDVRRATIAAKGFESIGLELKVIRTSGDNLVEDLPHIIELFETRKIKALSVYPLPIYYYLAPAMVRDGFKVTIGGHGADELLGAYDSWKELNKSHQVQIDVRSRLAFINAIYDNMMRRASIIFMNRGPIESRFPFLSVSVCEYMLGIDPKWLIMSTLTAESLLSLIEKRGGPRSSWTDHLNTIYNYLSNYLDNNGEHPEDIDNYAKSEIEKLFWKLPMIVAGSVASERSFLPFNILFSAKLRGQHGAGITSLEPLVLKKYSRYGSTDSEIYKNIVKEKYNL